MMNDHQDSEHFMGVRSESEFLNMLDKAERKMNHHYTLLQKGRHRKQLGLEMRDETKDRIYHMRNYKALEGVVKTLRWALGDMNVEHPLE
tara:strand:+ start:315 stop:584 length:270 start_codon:yes stop_codon:yes gene_type:complete